MIDPGHEIDWLIDNRPRPDAPSTDATDRARAALIDHGVRRRRARRRTGALAAGGVIAAGAVVAVTTAGGSPRPAGPRPPPVTVAVSPPPILPGPGRRASPRPHTALVELAADVQRMPLRPQPGDATLVVRDTVVDGSHRAGVAVYGGYDLYTDAGHYYYAPYSLAQLQQLYDTHQVSVDGGNEARALRRIAAAADGTPARARAAVLYTEPRHGRPPTAAQERRFIRSLPKRDRRMFREGERHPDLRLDQDSGLWGVATEALAVGAGRSDVRAAAIKALSTLRGVTQTPTRIRHIAALKVTFPDGDFPERIWLDARTGVPIQEKDGNTSSTAFVVQRVTAAHLPTAVSPRARRR